MKAYCAVLSFAEMAMQKNHPTEPLMRQRNKISFQNNVKLVQLWPEIPVISTKKTPFIECIIPFITPYNGHNCVHSPQLLRSQFPERHGWATDLTWLDNWLLSKEFDSFLLILLGTSSASTCWFTFLCRYCWLTLHGFGPSAAFRLESGCARRASSV